MDEIIAGVEAFMAPSEQTDEQKRAHDEAQRLAELFPNSAITPSFVDGYVFVEAHRLNDSPLVLVKASRSAVLRYDSSLKLFVSELDTERKYWYHCDEHTLWIHVSNVDPLVYVTDHGLAW